MRNMRFFFGITFGICTMVEIQKLFYHQTSVFIVLISLFHTVNCFFFFFFFKYVLSFFVLIFQSMKSQVADFPASFPSKKKKKKSGDYWYGSQIGIDRSNRLDCRHIYRLTEELANIIEANHRIWIPETVALNFQETAMYDWRGRRISSIAHIGGPSLLNLRWKSELPRQREREREGQILWMSRYRSSK